jgi:heme A synthase
MKTLTWFQTIFLAATVAMGGALKTNALTEARMLHRSCATLAGLVAIALVFVAFKNRHTMTAKALSVAILVLTFAAGLGGKMAASGIDYELSYVLMAGSGTLALVAGVVLLVMTHRSKV